MNHSTYTNACPQEMARCRRFGFSLLALTAFAGLSLELAHGLKLAPYLDDELTRLLLTLAHAHAAGGALVVLAFGSQGTVLFPAPRALAIGRTLRIGVALLALGFALGSIEHPEGDPNLLIVLAPAGGLLVAFSLTRIALATFGIGRDAPSTSGEDSMDR